jgi:excisionase family DNA binding protein
VSGRPSATSWIDARAVAELLAVPATWVLDHARAGTIPHYKFGRYVRFVEEEVLAWAHECRSGGRSATLRKYEPRISPGDARTSRGATPKG